MLRFSVFDNTSAVDAQGGAGDASPGRPWSLANAYMVGHDDLPIAGKITYEDGQIVCKKRGSRAAGVSLIYDAGSMGRLMLQTSLLPDRDKPYLLSVELARHRIKMFIAKSEEWQMFDLSDGHPAMQLWEQARQLFSRAVVCEDPLEADRTARLSLEKGIDATERLAMAHAEILLHRRFANRRASSSTLGVRISPTQSGTQMRDLIAREFDVLYLPLRWRDLEVEEGRYNWEPVDRWMHWAKETGKPVVAGPLLDFSKAALPKWMYVWQHDYDTCRDMAYDHIERVVQRYHSYVGIWNLAAGININDNFRFTNEQMVDLVRMASLVIRQLRKGSRMMIELTEPFGEYGATNADSLQPLAFIDRLVQEGIRLDAIGLQLLFGQQSRGAPISGRAARDLMQISSMLDKFFLVEFPLIVSAMSVPSAMPNARDAGSAETDRVLDGGWWHEPWSPQIQSSWVGRVFAMAMSKPYVESLIWSDLFDHVGASGAHTGLISEEGRGKPALQRLVGVRKRLRKPLGPLKLPSRVDAIGEASK